MLHSDIIIKYHLTSKSPIIERNVQLVCYCGFARTTSVLCKTVFFVYSSNHLWSHGSVPCHITCALLSTCSRRAQTLLCTNRSSLTQNSFHSPRFQPNKLVQTGWGSEIRKNCFTQFAGKFLFEVRLNNPWRKTVVTSFHLPKYSVWLCWWPALT